MWILLLVIVLLSCTGAVLLFMMACARGGGPLGRLLPSLLHTDGNPIDEFSDEIERGKEWFAQQKWEDLWIESHDGLRLHGYFLAHPQPERAILCVHGYHGSPQRDFAGALAEFYAAGSSLLVVDQRAHGLSEGRYISFGALERRDVQRWAEALDKRLGGALPIVLDGISMGASTVLMAGSEPMPASVSGVIADCGYTTPKEELTHVVRNMLHVRPFPAVQIVLLLARCIGGFSLSRASAKQGAAGWGEVPVLFVHGLADTFVPSYMSEENFKACLPPKDIYLVEGAEHGLSYLIDREGVRTKLGHLFRAAEHYYHKKHAKDT